MNKRTSKGWECPKCGRVNAIQVDTCPCYEKPEPKTQQEHYEDGQPNYSHNEAYKYAEKLGLPTEFEL